MITKKCCPVTGLSVDTLNEFSRIQVSKTFFSDFAVIGNSILYSCPSGSADEKGVTNSLLLNKKVEDAFLENRRYVQIEDYCFLTGSTSRARSIFVDTMNNRKNLEALIFCNVSPLVSLAIRIKNRFNTSHKKIYVEPDYSSAVKRAVEVSRDCNIEVEKPPFNFDLRKLSDSKNLEPVTISYAPEWKVEKNGFSSVPVVINNFIAHFTISGVCKKEYIDDIQGAREKITSSIGPAHEIRYYIVNAEKLSGPYGRARSRYIKSIRGWAKIHPLNAYFIFGVNRKMHTIVKLSSFFVPFEVIITKNLNHALSCICKKELECARSKRLLKAYTAKENERSYTNQLLTLLGSIDWEEKGLSDKISVSQDSPLYQPYESIKLIKEELDHLFDEKTKYEEELHHAFQTEQYLFRELQHRVKNSFSLINSMIDLKKQASTNQEVLDTLTEIQQKIFAVSDLYNMLDTQSTAGSAQLDRYLSYLVERYQVTSQHIHFETDLDTIYVPAKISVPIGLIISELVTNSLKHAFPSNNGGTITIVLKESNGCLNILYKDSGNGTGFQGNPSEKSSQGMNLIEALVMQIGGMFEYKSQNGFTCQLELPLEKVTQ